MRAYKHERRLEVWARPGGDARHPFVRVASFPILGLSGVPGPKRRAGDLQVPEGFYRITRFNPRSRFYLSLGLDYPNESDQRLAPDPGQPGSDIFIHGREQSRGCLAIGDEAMAWLYLAALDTAGLSGQVVTVHLFPCQTDAPAWEDVLAPWLDADPSLHHFWRSLARGWLFFERTRLPPRIRVDAAGGYVFDGPGGGGGGLP